MTANPLRKWLERKPLEYGKIRYDRAEPEASPIRPPRKLISSALTMNAESMFQLVAPRALRMPISLVCLVTLVSVLVISTNAATEDVPLIVSSETEASLATDWADEAIEEAEVTQALFSQVIPDQRRLGSPRLR